MWANSYYKIYLNESGVATIIYTSDEDIKYYESKRFFNDECYNYREEAVLNLNKYFKPERIDPKFQTKLRLFDDLLTEEGEEYVSETSD